MKKMLVMVAAALMSVTALAQYDIEFANIALDTGMSTTPSCYSAYIFENQAADDVQAAADYIAANGISANNEKVIAYLNDATYNVKVGQIIFDNFSLIDGNNRGYSETLDKAWLAVIYNDGSSQAKFKVLANKSSSSINFDDYYGDAPFTSWLDYNPPIIDPTSTPEPTSGLLLLLGMAGLALKRRG